ncbi:alpha-amylase family glycosyl hydrolase [Meiothermus taiwanensis]|uniref:alpha-amylase family glycosyl hydrolase n=1 Tax=Meiothermus taiwanensis TaxID=172827 RepID=UPI0005B6A09C|nr:alpha-amylase family glycosyl hydrolase [Meiothermus taiwanensis]KIQ53865.1 alpha-amylase [Meiothermus taiwanensis]
MNGHQTLPGAFEFHVSKSARDYYRFDLSLFSLSGNVILADFEAARRFAEAINARRNPEQAVSPGQVNAMGLIDELLHLIVRQYLEAHPRAMQEALSALRRSLGPHAVEQALRTFAALFPPIRVYRGEIGLEDYLSDTTEGRSNREILLEELLMLWMANANPAFSPLAELFEDEELRRTTAYLPIIQKLEAFFEGQPAFGQTGLSLFKTLRLPALLHPHSLEAQLEFLLQRFGGSLGRFYYRMLVGLDVIREEGRSFAAPVHFDGPGGGGGGQSEMLEIRRLLSEPEPEAFSPDLDWMPRCVLIAKNTYVWLDQLSKKYRREIRTLDQIPEEELAWLQSWGVTGLWLIGLWERSKASARIKQRMGNPEAMASAYALYDYVIAQELGGEEALGVLREKAARYGLRLAADLVPNHVGIDGRWVIEHPDWFIQLPYPPYPSYTFNGPDLSSDERVGIFLEDHYYDKTDAAVVFKWVNRQTGEVRYIYHGNDGTAMPWNDTAQLNYLLPEVREAMIQTILQVARQFPIIRFDAAMTLAKRHIQRLWWPEPGGSPWGASVPSRAAFAMSKEDFDRAMPKEFWREVVDRAAVEAPNTLLLAEAFWMMEGYFVRTLGMHRVYNSAFMNMLRDEKNAEYQQIVKNTLEFEPEILKRFVNFLNNPDEKTALEQFGKGDKYFGVMTLCATLPGLPMLGHGQVEGLSERYGMEYRRAYYHETPDEGLIAYHQQQIFPLLKKRYLFAEVENFVFYDAHTGEAVNEDVFAYSNRAGSERALVVYHNKNAETRVWVRQSVAQSFKTAQGRETRRVGLGQGLQLSYDARTFSIFRDLVTGLEHLHNNQALHEQGLYLELGPYQRRVFLDWREVYDHDGTYARLAQMLSGRGVPSMDEARQELWLGPILQPFRELLSPALFRRLLAAQGRLDGALREEVQEKLLALYRGIEAHTERKPALLAAQQVLDDLAGVLEAGPHTLQSGGALLGWVFTHGLGSPALLEEWRLGRVLEQTLVELGLDEAAARRAVGLTRLLLAQSGLALKPARLTQQMPRLLQDPAVQSFLGVNRFEGQVYFNREAHQAWLEGLGKLAQALYRAQRKPAAQIQRLGKTWQTLQQKLEQAALESGFTVDGYLRAIAQKARPSRKASVKVSSPAAQSRPQDDLERIKGIGPKIAAALQAAGISTYAQLAKTKKDALRKALAAAGIRLAPSLDTWARQAAYLARGDTKGLASYLQRKRPSGRG